jgi:hypothetical protein
MIHKGKDY